MVSTVIECLDTKVETRAGNVEGINKVKSRENGGEDG